MFTKAQLKQLSDRGISPEQALGQLEIFRKGIAPVSLVRPAIPGDGIEVYDTIQIDNYVNLFRKEQHGIPVVKFVPASGAASRMFKQLFEALQELNKNPGQSAGVLSKMSELADFFEDLKNYPFYKDLAEVSIAQGNDPESLIVSENYAELLSLFLSSRGLSYGELPKGLLKFHNYPEGARTAFEEHFVEAAMYLGDANNHIRLHFTVSPEHRKLFDSLAADLIQKFEAREGLHFDVDFSEQKPSTDTIAANMENSPFLLDQEKLLFRPGGHGALLDNMQDINEYMAFVGNIDNISPDRVKAQRVRYKQLLGGILIERVQKIHSFLNRMEQGIASSLKAEIIEFLKQFISASSASELAVLPEKDFAVRAKTMLDRPIRVCGMVKNVGEPGGGPFWISDKNGTISKQIVESSQVDLADSRQDKIFKDATHFNPVDMACYTRNYKAEKFHLEQFRDPDMAFIAVKSQGGSSLKALELPGLWNGSMAGWLTFFVDVPIETFSPVKTIFDLRREEHKA